MKRRPKQLLPEENPASSVADVGAIAQVKVWLLGVSPMVWRRVRVPSSCTLRELHGVFQVAMGWEGIHLYQFCLRAARYGSWEVSARSPDVTLAALRFRKGARFLYEYDLNVPWRHEVRIENRLEPEAGKAAQGRPFVRRTVNGRLRRGEHRDLGQLLRLHIGARRAGPLFTSRQQGSGPTPHMLDRALGQA